MALETLAIYLIPFLVIGIAIRLVMRRYSVDLPTCNSRPERNAGRARFSCSAAGAPNGRTALSFGIRRRKCTGHHFKERARITLGAAVALVVVGWIAVIAIAATSVR